MIVKDSSSDFFADLERLFGVFSKMEQIHGTIKKSKNLKVEPIGVNGGHQALNKSARKNRVGRGYFGKLEETSVLNGYNRERPTYEASCFSLSTPTLQTR